MTEPLTAATAAESIDAAASTIQTAFMQDVRSAGKSGLEPVQAAMSVVGAMRASAASEAAAIAILEREAAAIAGIGGHEAARLKLGEIASRRAAFEARTVNSHATARSLLDVAEAGLRQSLVPKGSADPGRRALARAEIDQALRDVRGAEIVNHVDRLIGADDDLTSELLRSGYGQRLVERQGENQRQGQLLWRAVQLQATEKLKATATTEPARAAVRGLAGLDKLRGSIDATKAAAFMKAGITPGRESR